MINRRGLLYAGAATLAAAAGVGAAWWRLQAPGGTSSPDDGGFWNLTFDSPEGKSLAMSEFSGRPLLVNFWATWCPPCVEELPLLNGFYLEQRSRGWQVLGLAVDQTAAVRTWLSRAPLDFPVAMAGLAGTELSRNLGNLTGGLPFTLVFGAAGAVLHRKSGPVTKDDLALWAQLR